MFINQADSEMLGITYKGEMESNIKEQKYQTKVELWLLDMQ